MIAWYPWLKALHVAFMVTWFAGLFYLPRLFIYHAEADDEVSRERFVVMQRRLFAIMTIGAILTLLFGLLLLAVNPGLLGMHWFKAKLVLLVALAAFHLHTRVWMRRLRAGYRSDDTTALRWYNELPVVFLLSIVLLAVAKPF